MGLIRIGKKHKPEFILSLIGSPYYKGNRVFLGRDAVNTRTMSLYTFKRHGIICECCGLKGEYFVKEKQTMRYKKDQIHLNLYGIKNGREVLFTSDHIVPKKKGGSNGINNRQTLCKTCNSIKAAEELKNSELFIKVIDKQLEKEKNKLKYSEGRY